MLVLANDACSFSQAGVSPDPRKRGRALVKSANPRRITPPPPSRARLKGALARVVAAIGVTVGAALAAGPAAAQNLAVASAKVIDPYYVEVAFNRQVAGHTQPWAAVTVKVNGTTYPRLRVSEVRRTFTGGYLLDAA